MRKKEKPEIGVYQIEINGKRYIGSTTKSFKERWEGHLRQLRKGAHGNSKLQNAFNEFGENMTVFSVLEIVINPDKLVFAEQRHIDELKPEYNISQIARYGKGRILYKDGKPYHAKHPPNKISITLRPELGARLWELAEERKVTVSVLVEEVLRKAVE